ncbi:MAG: hypothetical protein NXI32_10825 [bacterium]|nr:hypothetical protein [bacterium]
MFDDETPPSVTNEAMPSSQLSLAELFFITSLSAFALWLYVYVHPFVASLAAAILLFVAILRQLGRRPVVVGGLAGFAVATVLSWAICILGQIDMGLTIIVVLLGPCAGYVAGAFMTELADDGMP